MLLTGIEHVERQFEAPLPQNGDAVDQFRSLPSPGHGDLFPKWAVAD